MALIRLCGALIGWPFGFTLGIQLLQISEVAPFSSRILVVFLLGAACAILGWLGAPYVTVMPARWVHRRINAMSAGDLVGGAFGAGVGLALALLLAYPLSLLPADLSWIGPTGAAAFLGLSGAAAGISKHGEILGALRSLRGGHPVAVAAEPRRLLVDTSVIIDGRIVDVVRAGFIRDTLLVPRFILGELQAYADSADAQRRERGRRGLDLLARLQQEAVVPVEISDDEPAAPTNDAKLVVLARALGSPIVSNDYGLARVAELQGVTVLNLNELAKALRPVLHPGEELMVRLVQPGKEAGQAVGYLEDGTMIVVENAAAQVGTELRVSVMRVLQTAAGRLVFAQPHELVAARRIG